MKHGLFINQRKSQCSIYESGVMIKDVLRLPQVRGDNTLDYTLDYIETDAKLSGIDFHFAYDFYLINWHPWTLAPQLNVINKLRGEKIAVVLEVTKDNYLPYTPKDWFNAYMVIDPTKKKVGNLYPFPRPLETAPELKPLFSNDKIVIGGFGLVCPTGPALLYKRYYELVENANKIGNCIVRLNFPTGTYTGISLDMLKEYGNSLRKMAKSNVEVIVTHDYMTKPELIQWCSENTVNSFPYYRDLSGLSAVTDQAIVAGRPLIVTNDNTFRHIHSYINSYPKESYKSLITSSMPGVLQMQKDWHPDNFRNTFKMMLKERGLL